MKGRRQQRVTGSAAATNRKRNNNNNNTNNKALSSSINAINPIHSSNNSSKRKKQDSSFLAKLQMLREFVGGFEESDLSNCLRQCGYNVELAAERLMTGQYTPSPQGSSPKSFFSATPTSATTAAVKRPRVEQQRPQTTAVVPSTLSSKTGSSQSAANTVTITTASSNESFGMHLLLCQRWLVGLSTTRARHVAYKETLELTSSQTGPPMVRFRGNAVEGTLPLNLCTMLAPLLRYSPDTTADTTTTAAATTASAVPLISITAEALMDERNIPIGGEVPLSLSLFIEDPVAFFALFETSNNDNSATKDAWLATKQQQQSKKKLRLRPMAEAAFALLQWAEYGDVPQFVAPAASKENNETQDDNDDDDDDSNENVIIMREDEFETEESQSQQQQDAAKKDQQQQQQPEWAESIVEEGTGDSSLPEALDPVGLLGGVTLRPYQKQALYWMTVRESGCDAGRETLEHQLALLSELSQYKHSHTNGGSRNRENNAQQQQQHQSVSCECGPVLVSDRVAKQSATLGGTVDPVNHPLWQRRFLAKPGMKETISFYVNELIGVASAETPNPPRQCAGGLLADAMGLGKTVMLLSLILKDKQDSTAANAIGASDELKNNGAGGRYCGTTLVIAPLSLITQWEEEIATKTTLTHRVYYGDTAHGGNFDGVDVVITTYGTVQQAYISSLKQQASKKSTSCGILRFAWRRVILDEAHCIKNPQTAVSKACCSLKGERRWCITGTPIQNSLQDVYGLLKFLKHEPWCEGGFWKAAITSAMNQDSSSSTPSDDSSSSSANNNSSHAASSTSNNTTTATSSSSNENAGLAIAIDRVRRLLTPLILRRTKHTLSKDGKPILTLPPVETKMVTVEFSPAEREFYNSLLEKSQAVFEGFIESGTATKSWFAIFSLLQRLRQACDHVALTVKSQIDPSEWASSSSSSSRPSPSKESNDSGMPEPSKSHVTTSTGDSVNDKFLEGLLEKFRSKQSPSKREDQSQDNKENTVFSSQVAHSLSQAIQSEATTVEEECPICLENPKFDDAVITPCAHIFCRDCLVSFLRENASKSLSSATSFLQSSLQCPDGQCPCCNTTIKANRIIAMSKSSQDGRTTTTYLISDSKNPSILRVKKASPSRPVSIGARQTLENALRGAESSKLSAVISELHEVWKLDPGSKVIIFSQYLGFLSLLEVSLRNESISFNRLDGKMNLKERVAALEKFNRGPSSSSSSDDSTTTKGSVLLVSMKAGGVGLNLVAASSVFILDPWWNAAVEDQCINRIHRIGQTAEVVRVRKFVVEDSVEERIVELQRRKKDMASDILSDARTGGDMSNAQPTLDDFRLIFGK